MLKFVLLPLIGFLVLNIPGIIIGIVLAFILDNTKKSKEIRERKSEEAATKVQEKIDNTATKLDNLAYRINADTERRKQNKINKKEKKHS